MPDSRLGGDASKVRMKGMIRNREGEFDRNAP